MAGKTGCRFILTVFMAPLCRTPSRRLEFLCPHSHLRDHSARPSRRGSERTQMTLFHTHRGEVFGSRGLRSGSRLSAARAVQKISAALKMMHRAIEAAKLRRLRNELML